MEECSKEHLRFYVYTRFKNDITAGAIQNELASVWHERAPALRTVQHWIKEFRGDSRVNFTDALRSGRPRTSTDSDSKEKVRQALDEDSFLSLRQIADMIESDKDSVARMLHEMDYRNVCGMWIPHELSESNKLQRVQCCKNIVHVLNTTPDIATVYAVLDESWVYFDNVSHKKRSAWVGPSGDRPQMVRFSPMTKKKTMLSVCFSPNGRFYLSTTPYGEAINSPTFVEFLQKMRELWRKRRRNSIHFSTLLLQMDNAPSHTAVNTQRFLEGTGVQLVKQAPYSPDLNLCDRFLFRGIKHSLKNSQISCQSDVENAATHYMNSLEVGALQTQIEKLKLHCDNVIKSGGSYVDCSKYNC